MQRHRHDPSKNYVGFVVGNVEYAVAIAQVREIANPLPVVPLPHASRSVAGVADYRGQVVSVVDLRSRFGLPAAPITRKTKWIVVGVDAGAPERSDAAEAAGALVALVVDAVTEVFGSGGSDLRPAPQLGSGEDIRGISGVTTHAAGLVFVLDTTRLRDLAERTQRQGSESPADHRLPEGVTP
jgi:purine-binding chemotaxis protein CheW